MVARAGRGDQGLLGADGLTDGLGPQPTGLLDRADRGDADRDELDGHGRPVVQPALPLLAARFAQPLPAPHAEHSPERQWSTNAGFSTAAAWRAPYRPRFIRAVTW